MVATWQQITGQGTASPQVLSAKDTDRHVSTVVNAPSIPIPGNHLTWWWILPWFVAVCISLLSVPLIRPLVFHKQWMDLPDEPVDLTIDVAGCDLEIIEHKSVTKSKIRMQYWKMMGGYGEMKKVSDKKFEVNAKTLRKVDSFPCKVQVMTSPHMNRVFRNLDIKVDKDQFSKFNPGPSNVGEYLVVRLESFKVNHNFTLDVRATAETTLIGTRVGGLLDANVRGGKLEIHEAPEPEGKDPVWFDDKFTKEPYLPSKMNLRLEAATVVVKSHNNNVKAHLYKKTVDDAILAGARVEKRGHSGHLVSYYMYKGSHGSDIDLTLAADNCAIYLSAYDKDFYKGDDNSHPLVKVTGDSVKDVSLLKDGEEAMVELADWLVNGTHNSKFVVYIQLTAPSVPPGTFRLLSTSSYMALSMSLFSLISGGMLTPEIVRLMTPVRGFTWLFPRRPCDGEISEEHIHTFSMDSFLTLIKYVDLQALGLPQAVWIWDPSGPEFDIFDYIAKKDKWRQRPVGSTETFKFRVAAVITLGLGVFVGGIACALIAFLLLPDLKASARDLRVTNAGSYQLTNMIPVTDWKVPVAVVRYPTDGVLLRWNKRDDMAQFSRMAIRARKWPVDESSADVIVDKISPYRIPEWPLNPAQQVFLFGTAPPPKAPPHTPAFKKLFDGELYATAMLCCGTSGLPLPPGGRYQFRIDAYGSASPKPLEKSEWSRPVRINSRQMFTEIPLILWKAVCGVYPEDTFQHFLTCHCLPIENAPSLQIHITNMKLCLVNDSALFMGKGGAYGQDIEVSDFESSYAKSGVLTGRQYVEIQASTGSSSEELAAADMMFEKTNDFMLPGMNSEKRKSCESLPDLMEGKNESSRTHGMEKMKFLVVDMDKLRKPKKESLTLRVGLDLTQTVRIETVLIEDLKGQDKNSAKYEDTWKEFISGILHAKRGDNNNARLIDEIIMRDGLTPAAMLIADCELMNSAIRGNLKKKTTSAQLPEIFSHVIPGMTFVWGETVALSWTFNDQNFKVPSPEFDILLVSEQLSHLHDNYSEEGQRKNTLVAMDVQFSSEKATVAMCPKQPYSVFCMRCHLEMRFHKEHTKVSASSDEFVIVRPISQQDLELGYASFCTRNDIPMERFERGKLTPFYGIELLEKSLNVCTGYRQPLPIVGTGEPEENLCTIVPDNAGQPLVKNPDSHVIVDPHGLVIPKEASAKAAAAAKAKSNDAKKAKGGVAAASDAEAGKEEETSAIPARNEMLDIPTNVFWKKDSSWEEEVLLVYALVPFFANGQWLEDKLNYYNLSFLSNVAFVFDRFIRFCLKTWLYLYQLTFLFFPGFLVMFVLVKMHTIDSMVNPNLKGSSVIKSVALGQVISPSVFTYRSLPPLDLMVYWFFVIYFGIIVLTTFYGNFIHNKYHVRPVYLLLNSIVLVAVMASFYLLVVYISVVLVWILMGSIIDPASVMPYALLFLGALYIGSSVWSKTSAYRAQVLKQMEDKLDLVTHAVMGIFVGEEDSSAGPDFVNMVDAVTELMRQAEKDTVEKLYKQAGIETQVDGCDRDLVLKLRDSDEFKACFGVKDEDGKPGVQNKCMSTDFVPRECWAPAQAKSNEMALLANKRLAPDDYGTVPDEKINAEALAWAMSQQNLDGLGDPLKVNKEDAAEVSGTAKKIGLRPSTANICHKSFSLALSMSSEPALSDPLALQTIFTSIRMEQLFKHFVCEEEPNPDGKGKKGKVKSTALSYLKDLEKKDLLNIDAAFAKALSSLLYWPTVSRRVAKFVATSIRDSVTFAVSNQLNPVMQDTAAFKVRTKSCDCLYNNFEKVYKSNHMQFFVDVGVVEEKFSKTDECKSMINTAVSNFLNFDGSLDPSGLISAIDWICFPFTRQGPEGQGSGQMNMKNYFWYDALLLSLQQLGWNPEELEETWLQSRWLELTQNRGVFAYSSLEEVNTLITVGFADGGLWKSAIKALMLNVKIGGYAAANLERDGMEKASKLAHTIINGDKADLKFLNDNLRWPPLMQDVWDQIAVTSKGGEGKDKKDANKPNFLELVRIDKFLQAIIYMPDIKDKAKIKRTQLNPLAIDDLQWYKGEDGGLWDGDGSGTKRIRGIWLELLLEVFDILECFPTDLDLFFQCLEWQYKEKGTSSKWLQYTGLKWLESDYLAGKEADTATLTANEFYLLLRDYMNCDIPSDVLTANVFKPCPLVPDDDNGELRYLKDVSGALRYWIGYGLWQGAIEQVVMYLMPRSNLRRLALQVLAAEFAKADTSDIGVLQPGQAIALLRKLTHPGLTCPDLSRMLKDNLQLEIPERELHKYFTMNDVNGDGVLQVGEFVCTIRYLMTNYYPETIMRNMSLSYFIIFGIILGVVATLVAAFICVTLVVKAFTTGGGVSHAVHSGVTGMTVAYSKIKSDKQVGADDTVSAVRAQLETTLTTVICGTLGLSTVAADKLSKMGQELQSG